MILLLPEFYEADINLLFHNLQTDYYPKHRLWYTKSDIDRNTIEFPIFLTSGLGEGLTSLPGLENGIRERSQSTQTLEIKLSSTDQWMTQSYSFHCCLFPFKRRKNKGFDWASGCSWRWFTWKWPGPKSGDLEHFYDPDSKGHVTLDKSFDTLGLRFFSLV